MSGSGGWRSVWRRTRVATVLTAVVAALLPTAVMADGSFDIVVLGGPSAVSDEVLAQLDASTSGGVSRTAGADRFATAAALSAASFEPGAPVAYIATGADFPDALAAGPLAALEGGPILLVTRDGVPDATAGELERLRPERIVVAGGTGAVSDAVVQRLRSLTAGSVERRSGPDRFSTAAAISAAGFSPGVSAVYVATGTDFPDALAGVPSASGRGAPILLAMRSSVPAATAAELERLDPGEVIVLGGPGVLSDAVAEELGRITDAPVSRLAGSDRFATAGAISAAANDAAAPTTIFVATGLGFADALAGGPVAGLAGAPILLATSASLPAATAAELTRLANLTVRTPPQRLTGAGFVDVARPLGVSADAQGNVYVSYDAVSETRVSLFSPAGVELRRAVLGGFFDIHAIGRMERDPITGEVWLLLQDGTLVALAPDLGAARLVTNLRTVGINATSFHDLSTGVVGAMGGVIVPQAAHYGDIAIRRLNQNTRQVFVSGVSTGFPFVARLVVQGNNVVDARVISASRTQSVEENVPRGVAVSPQGIVLTTLPLPNTDNRITFTPQGNLDVLVRMSADYVPGAAVGVPQVVLPRQAVVSSRGMTADAAGRFYVATSAIGILAPGRVQSTGGALVVLPPALNGITAIGEVPQSLITDFQDVTVDVARRRAFVAVNGVGGLAPDGVVVFGLP